MTGVMEPVAGSGVARCGSGQLSSFASSAFHSGRGPGLQGVPGGRRDLELDRAFVNLTPQLEELVRAKAKVASGMYSSGSEVVREALRLMDKQDRLRAAKPEQLREDVRHGLESGTCQPWSAEDAKREAHARRERKLA
jgi:antitoxin ParD1/3/4